MNPPPVSVVIPCRNEHETIERCLDSLVASDYPPDRLEVLVVDGLSTDGTRAIVTRYQASHPNVHLLDNSRRTQQAALNIGVRAAAGEVIVRMDAHCRFSPGHITECVRHLLERGADNVGGRLVTVPRRDTLIGRAIAIAMSERFGVGASRFRLASGNDTEPRWVDTVPYSCYRRDVFDRIGLFNEDLDRSEDAEFHGRMRAGGCKTLLIPSLVSHYYARSDYRSFAAHAVDNGWWAILPTKYTGRLVVSGRHLTPLCFVLSLIILGSLAPFSAGVRLVLAAITSMYLMASVLVSLSIAWRERRIAFLWTMPVIFLTLHLGYGLGSLVAAFDVLATRGLRR